MGIAQEAIAMMIHMSGMNDANRIYLTTVCDHLDFNLAYLDQAFELNRKEEFDPYSCVRCTIRGTPRHWPAIRGRSVGPGFRRVKLSSVPRPSQEPPEVYRPNV
jgi:hypothetical protein